MTARPAEERSLGLAALVVPANSSRFFDTQAEALRQPTARVDLAWNEADPYLYNASFAPELISHDESYCTSVVDLANEIQLPTSSYLYDQVLPLLTEPLVADIGCGQGEFVASLRRHGVEAVGYDPVLRKPGEGLFKCYWSAEEQPADLYVMRCVLPHIPAPWDFLDQIAASAPGSRVLIEFQRIEWIIDEHIWFQLSHDHVNLFSIDDFQARYDVHASGTFSQGEWGWVLIDPATRRVPGPRGCHYLGELTELIAARADLLESVRGTRLVPWGAAGKGIVLTQALLTAGAELPFVIDADPLRWGRYLECSGRLIISPEEALGLPTVPVAVANPNHLPQIREKFGDSFDLHLVRDFEPVRAIARRWPHS